MVSICSELSVIDLPMVRISKTTRNFKQGSKPAWGGSGSIRIARRTGPATRMPSAERFSFRFAQSVLLVEQSHSFYRVQMNSWTGFRSEEHTSELQSLA